MKWPWQKTSSDAGRQLAMRKYQGERALIRARCDQMRADMGMPKVEWPQ